MLLKKTEMNNQYPFKFKDLFGNILMSIKTTKHASHLNRIKFGKNNKEIT